MNIKEQFVQFLLDNDCYEEYFKYLDTDMTEDNFFNKASTNFIRSAFSWDETDGGTDYWAIIDNKWITYIEGLDSEYVKIH